MNAPTATEETTAVIDLTTKAGADVGFRYPGSPPFRDNDLERQLFKGRARESATVLHSILGSDLFLLYAVSGLGKTSLLNAGVMHELRERGYWPVSVRLNDPQSNPTQAILRQMRAYAAADPQLELESRPGAQLDSADLTLWEMLGSLEVWRNDELQQLVLVLDQFEELFTLGWDDEVRQRFIGELGDVVRRHQTGPRRPSADGARSSTPPPRVKFVLVIREDALGELEALATDIPNYMRHRFRLGPLDVEQAESAVREPGLVDDGRIGSQRFEYTEAAAEEILDFLRTTTSRGALVQEDTVDPSQLQIVCQYVERAILPNKQPGPGRSVVTIDAQDLGGRDGLEHILGDFYERTVASFPKSQQGAVADLCESGLVNQNGRRLSLEEGEIGTTHAVTPEMLQQLVDHRLLRADPRVGSVYYEISHDTLVAPILAHRSRRRAIQLRKRLRWAAAALGVVAITLGAVGAGVLSSNDAAAEASAVPLALDEPVAASIDDTSSIVRFAVDEEPTESLMIAVVPGDGGESSLDVEIGGANRAPPGAPEWAFLAPSSTGDAPREVNVTGNGSTGAFTVTATLAEPATLTAGEDAGGTIDSVGGFDAFAVVGDVNSELILVATPVTTGEGGRTKPLEMEIQVVAPDGTSRAVNVVQDGSATFTVGGTPGVFYVLVRGGGESTGPFTVGASALDAYVEALPAPASDPGGPSGSPGRSTSEGAIAGDQPVAVIPLDVPAGTGLAIEVLPDAAFDPVLEVISPDGATETVDFGGEGVPEFATKWVGGLYELRITGFQGSTGSFQIGTSAFETAERLGEEPVGGSIDSEFDSMAFEFEGSGGLAGINVVPSGLLDPVLLIVDPAGITTLRDMAGEDPESIVFATEPGRYQLVVAGYGDTTGTFELAVTAPEVASLNVSTQVAGSIPNPGNVAVYEVATDGSELAVTVVPSGGLDALVEVADEPLFFVLSEEAGGVIEGTIGPREEGTVVLVVSGIWGATGDFVISVEPLAAST